MPGRRDAARGGGRSRRKHPAPCGQHLHASQALGKEGGWWLREEEEEERGRGRRPRWGGRRVRAAGHPGDGRSPGRCGAQGGLCMVKAGAREGGMEGWREGGRASASSRLLLLCSLSPDCFSLPLSSFTAPSACLLTNTAGPPPGLAAMQQPAGLILHLLCPPIPPLAPPAKPLPLAGSQLGSPQSISPGRASRRRVCGRAWAPALLLPHPRLDPQLQGPQLGPETVLDHPSLVLFGSLSNLARSLAWSLAWSPAGPQAPRLRPWLGPDLVPDHPGLIPGLVLIQSPSTSAWAPAPKASRSDMFSCLRCGHGGRRQRWARMLPGWG